jgi:hypothetical protein
MKMHFLSTNHTSHENALLSTNHIPPISLLLVPSNQSVKTICNDIQK